MTSRNDVRGEIRQFLTTRRAKITPEQAGLATYGGNRRVPGLRRQEVALLAGISIEYCTRLERGNARGASEDVLEGIARALQLDEVERAHLIDLVRTANAARPARPRAMPQRVRPSVQRLLDSMTGTAAFVRNGRLDSVKETPVPIQPKQPTAKGPAEWFTGDVWIDGIARGEEPSRVRVSAVRFTPSARTEAINLLIRKVKPVGHGFRNFANYRLRLVLHCGVRWQTHRTASLRGRSPRFMA